MDDVKRDLESLRNAIIAGIVVVVSLIFYVWCGLVLSERFAFHGFFGYLIGLFSWLITGLGIGFSGEWAERYSDDLEKRTEKIKDEDPEFTDYPVFLYYNLEEDD